AWAAPGAGTAQGVPATQASATEVPVPRWTGPVMDLASALAPGQAEALSDRLRALEQSSGAQIFVLIVPTTGTDSIEQYARRVFDQWRIGRKGVDDGILLLVARNDHTLRIETGYGVEG